MSKCVAVFKVLGRRHNRLLHTAFLVALQSAVAPLDSIPNVVKRRSDDTGGNCLGKRCARINISQPFCLREGLTRYRPDKTEGQFQRLGQRVRHC